MEKSDSKVSLSKIMQKIADDCNPTTDYRVYKELIERRATQGFYNFTFELDDCGPALASKLIKLFEADGFKIRHNVAFDTYTVRWDNL